MPAPADLRENVPLAPLTTIKVGGRARWFVECASVEHLKATLTWAKSEGLRVHVLGGGSNTVFKDEGFDGLVIRMGLEGMEFAADGKVTVAAGEEWDAFVKACVDRNLAGVECLAGIPGQAGATPIQNVGAYGQEVKDTIKEVRVLDVANLEERTFTNADCGFAYRWSRFKGEDNGKYIVTSVVFALTPNGTATVAYGQLKEAVAALGPSVTLAQVREKVLELRRSKSMVLDPADPNTRSCGSFFENATVTRAELEVVKQRVGAAGITDELPAFDKGLDIRVASAWLIEHAGFTKGMQKNGVGLSTKHALALITTEKGSASALLAFAQEIQDAVYAKFGVRLRPEPVVVG